MTHTHPIRVYYEDTDLAGIVYYANYLKFIERGRSEWVRMRGIDQTALKAGQGIVFAVRKVDADYLKPAKFDDELQVTTELLPLAGPASSCGKRCGAGRIGCSRRLLCWFACTTPASLHAFHPKSGRRWSLCGTDFVSATRPIWAQSCLCTQMCWQSALNLARIGSIGGQRTAKQEQA